MFGVDLDIDLVLLCVNGVCYLFYVVLGNFRML